MNYRNASFLVDGRIDCEIEHPSYGWIPFTADPNDVMEHGRELHAQMLVDPATAPYLQPTQEELDALLLAQRGSMSLTFTQLLIGLVTEGWITDLEGREWLKGNLPVAITTLIDTLPVEQQFIALARATMPSEVLRLDPLVMAMGAAEGKTEEEIDSFFLTYRSV